MKILFKRTINSTFFIIMMIFIGMNTSLAAISQETIKQVESVATKGDVKAQVLLGVSYYLGQEVKQDYKKAKKWLTMAAGKGNQDAQVFWGICILTVMVWNKILRLL